ncbi:hypothetical protein SLNWT_7104 [Streptomyces albus]|uniref:Uncharacterized protein n=1 Tax=Streptomyces albus (strain ATCC 21838 / DSM 41398 / FERM P-419 / JCM 4703 / NBRC 107858) TaxID=1081613 RepID=A0A0B5F7C7_STRA4|nr:hypothetical protein SLNWT_7104 [Streptomyces albus]AOU81784.1 hypothetical protein SLNHY_7093 [Streptomyces albus]AYN37471.1 hypothetical protein DUI70_6978 [Streptomyces albus]
MTCPVGGPPGRVELPRHAAGPSSRERQLGNPVLGGGEVRRGADHLVGEVVSLLQDPWLVGPEMRRRRLW